MKTQKEIEDMAWLKYPYIPHNIKDVITVDLNREKREVFVDAFNFIEKSIVGNVYNQNDLPHPSKDDFRYSVDVFIRLDEMFNVGFFDFEDKVWSFHTDTLINPDGKNFIWMYPNNEFFTHTGALAGN